MTGEVLGIYTAAEPQAPLQPLEEAVLEAGEGLRGDRYHGGTGTFSKKLAGTPDHEITLIESEEVERFNREQGLALEPRELRRNIITRGVRLNDLVNRRFNVGETVLEGIRLCEPCAHLARLVSPAVLPGLVHRAGLRARIVSGGTVRPGDTITSEPS